MMISTARHVEEVKRYANDLSALRTPTLIIWGDQDEVFPRPVAEDLHASIKGSELLVIKDSGHMPMWEHPDETNRAIVEFLRR